jgi:hypothetical protein
MTDTISSKLYISACALRDKLQSGNGKEIEQSRDQLRSLMIAQHSSGYWKERPEMLRQYMDLLYRCDRILTSLGPGLALTKRTNTTLNDKISLG